MLRFQAAGLADRRLQKTCLLQVTECQLLNSNSANECRPLPDRSRPVTRQMTAARGTTNVQKTCQSPVSETSGYADQR